MEMTNVVPLNRGSTKNAPPSCWMPEMPTARIKTPNIVPQTLTRPGLIVVEPRNAPTSAGKQIVEPDIRLTDPELGGQHAAGEAGDQPGGDEHADDVGADRDAVQCGRFLVGADRVDVPTERQPLADDPESDGQDESRRRRESECRRSTSC